MGGGGEAWEAGTPRCADEDCSEGERAGEPNCSPFSTDQPSLNFVVNVRKTATRTAGKPRYVIFRDDVAHAQPPLSARPEGKLPSAAIPLLVTAQSGHASILPAHLCPPSCRGAAGQSATLATACPSMPTQIPRRGELRRRFLVFLSLAAPNGHSRLTWQQGPNVCPLAPLHTRLFPFSTAGWIRLTFFSLCSLASVIIFDFISRSLSAGTSFRDTCAD